MILIVSFFVAFAFITMFGIIIMSYLGEQTPEHLVGKVMSLIMSLMFVGYAIGDFLYGFLLSYFTCSPGIALLILAGLSAGLALGIKIKA